MLTLSLIISYLTFLLSVSASPINETEPRASCTINSYNQVAGALASCTNIVINGIAVPAGTTLDLNLKEGSRVTLQGHITFGHAQWDGPLMRIRGKRITMEGVAGLRLDGQGTLYWDGLGQQGTRKPVFVSVEANGGSVISRINLLNCPERCVAVVANDLTLNLWNIDCSAGDTRGARNTDGFDVAGSNNVVIKNSVVKNQDDCVAINYGTNLHFFNLHCSGSHGLSLAVGMSKTNPAYNVVQNVTFSDSVVVNGLIAIHVKTVADGGTGLISDVTYKNIQFSGINYYGINIQEDYDNRGSSGKPTGKVPIKNLRMINVQGTVIGRDATPVYVLCGPNGCSNWQWSGVSVIGIGGAKPNSCNFKPSGFSC